MKTSLELIGAIPFDFQIPADATLTTPMHKLGFFRIGYTWTLLASSITPGIDYWKFEVPIAARTPGLA